MLKKLSGILFMLAILLLSSVSLAWAAESVGYRAVNGEQGTTDGQENMSMEKALEILRDAFPELCEAKDFELQNEFYGDDDLCRLIWRDSEYRPLDNTSSRITAAVDLKSGELTQFYYQPDPDLYKGKNAVLSRDEAFELAEAFIRRTQPDKLDELEVDDSNYYYSSYILQRNYNFSWKRMLNDIPLDWDGIIIEVDPVVGVITFYQCKWSNYRLPPATDIIPSDRIKNDLLDEIGVYPTYHSAPGIHRDDSLNPLIPVYELNMNGSIFDACSGKALEYNGEVMDIENVHFYSGDFEPEMNGAKIEDSVVYEQKLTSQKALQIATKFYKLLGKTGDIQQTGSELHGTDPYEENWSYSLSGKNKETSPRLRLNAYTGELISFYQPRDYSEGIINGNVISYKEAVNKAEDIIDKINPVKNTQTVLREYNQEMMPGSYFLRFDRLINGIPYKLNGIDIEIDKQTGDIVNYRLDWQDVKYLSLDTLISPEKALEIFKKEQVLNLTYWLPADEDYLPREDALLVYKLSGPSWIDAVSGEPVGEKKTTNSAELSEYSEHWAAPALSILYQSGLLPEEGIKPDEPVNRRHAIRVLTAAISKSYYYNDDKAVEVNFSDIEENDPDNAVLVVAIKNNILPNEGQFEADKLLSRETLAAWVCKSLGYQEIAQMKQEIEIPFKDANSISGDKKNYVGIVNGLGLMTADESSCFRPQDSVSWAELATVSLRLAPKLQ